MNKTEFIVEMKRHKDTQASLANAMGLARVTLNRKINEIGGSSFTQPELKFITDRYSLTAERAMELFFASNVS